MKVRRSKTPVPHIPFISLADIAWQIIIFFLVAATFAARNSLSVPMPTASPGVAAPLAKTVNVKASEGNITVNGVNVERGDLQSYIASLLTGMTRDEDRAVVFYPDNDLTFQRTSDVLYAIQKAGGIVVISEERRDENPTKAP
jgi:biopolymer transport protein ExbD